mgnify:CR=1 FL=1
MYKVGILGTFDFLVKGGAKNFGRVAKGGRKILDLVNFFSKFLKHSFFMFCGYFGHF